MKRTHFIALAALALGVLAAIPSVHAQTKKISYAITELPPWVSSNRSSANSINELGQVVGSAFTDASTYHACIWERVGGQWTIRDLGVPVNCPTSKANSINAFGEVSGLGFGTGFMKGFVHVENGLIELEGDEYPITTVASDINYDGDVCGYTKQEDPLGQAGVWERTGALTWAFTDLGVLTNCYQSQALDLNDSQQIVGKSWTGEGGITQACLWERNMEGQWGIEYPAGELRSEAHCINNVGQIVGTRYIDQTTINYACLWQRIDGQWTAIDLHANAPGLSESTAYEINNKGQVVGYAILEGATNTGVGFLYENGVMRNLNDFLPAGSGWSYLNNATGINEQGQIVGFGYNVAGIQHAFLMDTRQAIYSYTSIGSAVAIKDKASASKAMTLTDNATITDLNVKVTLYHTRYTDLQFDLVGPNNVTRRLCNPGAVTGSGTKSLVFDDDGAVGAIIPVNPLSCYDGTSTAGKWTLKITDTVKNLKTGSFTSFTLDVMPQL